MATVERRRKTKSWGTRFPTPVNVRALDDLKIWLEYEDGVKGVVDLSHRKGWGVFKAWDDQDFFNGVHINSETGAVCWGRPQGMEVELDYNPHTLYANLLGMSFDYIYRMDIPDFYDEVDRRRTESNARTQ